MRAIQMVDTKTQYQKIKQEVDEAVLAVMESSQFIGGKVVTNFAQNLAAYHQCKHVITCANGTDALQIALMALGLKAGDEVITPSFTYIATVEVAALLGIKPVFVDVDADSFCIDPSLIEKAITPKTKAIVPVHLYGHAAAMEEIMQIAKKHNLFVVEDNAQAIGNNYRFSNGSIKKTGTIGQIGCTSFYPSKNLGGFGDGGAICTNDDQLATIMASIANHGQSKRYYHDRVGCNSRLDAIQAAVLDIKLRHLDEYIAARQAAAAYYEAGFAGIDAIKTPKPAQGQDHVYHQYTIQLNGVNRDELSEFLTGRQVPNMIYYPVAAHQQKMFEIFGDLNTDLPVTEMLTSKVISLPIHTELDKEQQDYIIEAVKAFINQ